MWPCHTVVTQNALLSLAMFLTKHQGIKNKIKLPYLNTRPFIREIQMILKPSLRCCTQSAQGKFSTPLHQLKTNKMANTQITIQVLGKKRLKSTLTFQVLDRPNL